MIVLKNPCARPARIFLNFHFIKEIFMANKLAKEFKEYFFENPDMWDAYKKFAGVALNANPKRISIGMVAERIRWETTVTSGSGKYKVRSNFRAFYARLLMWKYPQYRGKFTLLKIDIDGASKDIQDVSTWNVPYWSQF